MTNEFDLVIRNGRIIDGTGNPYYRADVGFAGGKIRRIAKRIEPSGTRVVLDAENRVVCPGFVDAHTHDDLYLLSRPTCDDKVLQGVTTVVIGNCGQSVAPISDAHRDVITGSFKFLGSGLNQEDLNIKSFDDYLQKLEGLKPGINVIPLVGHSTVRMCTMGMANRKPTTTELKGIQSHVSNAMRDGAFGLSTGLIYAPGNYATTEEIVELAKMLTPFGGIYATHMRSESEQELDAIVEAIRIGEEAGVHVHIAHHKIAGKTNWGKSTDTLRLMAEARSRGIEVTCDQYPYRAGSTYLAAVLPPRVLADGPKVYGSRLRDAAFRAEIVSEIKDANSPGWENLIKGAGFDGIMISVSRHSKYVGKTIAEIADLERKDPFNVIFDLVAEESREVIAILFMMGDEDICRIMRNPWTMIGSDGIPGFGINRVHPRMTGTFPRVLGKYVRKEGVLSLEEAVRKMTSLPAQTFGLKSKGLLKEGFDADLVVFDPDTIIDCSTYEEPNRAPEGICNVFVNGQLAAENGRILGAASGQVLRQN
ncbi:MAG: D-aminoacylase [Deltaproteobacteria bacterium]|nr:D-aminoacylase [Deltaproteobacteria bacterium]